MTTRNGSLDLLRALAIAAVLACHLANGFARGTPLVAATSVGGRGVDLFFVLSGFLLGSQLFREREKTGTVNVRRFWVRRWLRTLPAYYAVLFATFAQFVVKGTPERIDWRYLVFVQNYLDPPPFLGVTWSLCVEEHFYLIVAPAVWLTARWRWGMMLCFTGVAVCVGLHVAGIYSPKDEHGYTSVSQVMFEPCLVGVLVGWLSVCRPRAWGRLRRWSGVLAAMGLLMVILAAVNRTAWDWWLPDWGLVGWASIFAAWVLLAHRSAWWENLHLRPVRFVAERAYSLYLVHTEAIAAAKKLTGVPEWGQAALALVLAFGLAELLYRCVERPFMRLRK